MGKQSVRQPLSVEMHSWTPELEPGVLRTLHAGFGEKWGDSDYWRWKHSTRPGFSPQDVIVFTDRGTAVACFHMAVHPFRLAPGLEVSWSVEGDFAIQPGWRGAGIFEKSNLRASRYLADRGVVLRAGFTTQALYDRVYRPKLGHRLVPIVTANYRKLLSDRALREKLQALGNRLRLHPSLRRLLAAGPITVELNVRGFNPCKLVIATDAATCNDQVGDSADLRVSMPYTMLTVGRIGFTPAILVIARAVSSGQLRARGVVRLLVRWACALSRR